MPRVRTASGTGTVRDEEIYDDDETTIR